jgi:GNAT superfamily N-acetyltransferase
MVVQKNGSTSCFGEYIITPARPQDVPLLSAIELAAAKLLAGYAPDAVLSEITSEIELDQAQESGQLWVALAGNVPVGFAYVKIFGSDTAHLEEIDVHPAHGRRGIGTSLVMTVCDWATASGCRSVTLTTFRDVPWNMPFYARLGFEVIPSEELSAAMLAIIENETRRGLDQRRRVAMRRICAGRKIATE